MFNLIQSDFYYFFLLLTIALHYFFLFHGLFFCFFVFFRWCWQINLFFPLKQVWNDLKFPLCTALAVSDILYVIFFIFIVFKISSDFPFNFFSLTIGYLTVYYTVSKYLENLQRYFHYWFLVFISKTLIFGPFIYSTNLLKILSI